ncbi:SDR family oxidoreductase [Sphingomonas beigongshangi]|uniref:SDR family oxidoreductase n=1 Tax=Sphingomonas beigongshangi TaxID=2782540 RepID=UPI001AEDD63F|nr:SDR family oxidoreductase [Sphingomonas beigongshangi]
MRLSLKPIEEQVMVITGASSGIGLATAQAAARAGARVLLVAREENDLRPIVARITTEGGTADAYAADVGDADALRAAAAHAAQRFGRIDTWINCAGVAIYGTLRDTPDDEHTQLFRTNYFGTVHGCLAAIPHLQGGGALITVGSIAGDMPSPLMGAYAASKHAVHAYVDTLRMEVADAGLPISVTLVKPSGIDTPIAQHAANHAGGEAQVPPPVYDPELVAKTILACSVRPRRAITVGGVGRAETLFAAHFPGLFGKIAPKAAAAGFVDPDKPQPQPSNLFGSVRTGHVRSGEHHARAVSLYTAAARRPAAITAVGLGIAASVGALIAVRRRA